MLIIGHRGVPSLELENTVSSFKKAEELGVDMIEFDVRLSKDGHIVVFHDDNLQRLFEVNKNVANLTVAELKQISNGQIPTFKEALEDISIPINVHMKVRGLEKQLLDELKNFSYKVLISSTFPGVLKKIRALDGNIQLGLIIGGSELHLMFILNWLVSDLNLFSIHPKNIFTSKVSLLILKWRRRKIIVWDVNTIKDFDRLVKWGVDGIITDYPQRFIK